ncbi:MAG: CBS domain-containing protein [Nitrospira sp.]|nr:CBS domain-containing protein [Nitrospira sp.]
MVTVGNVMQAEPVTVETGTSVVEAAKLMKSRNIESVLVTRKAKIIGIVTESDVVKKFLGGENTAYYVPVEVIMSSPLPGIEERRPLTEAADLMEKHRTLYLSVTRAGSFIGLISVRDFLRPVSLDEF